MNKINKRIQWTDGNVLSAQHFSLMEQWIEANAGLPFVSKNTFGLIRDSNEEHVNNLKSNISLNISNVVEDNDGSNKIYNVTIRNLKVIMPSGKFYHLEETNHFEIAIKNSDKNESGEVFVSLVPRELNDGIDRGGGNKDYEIEEDIEFYNDSFELITSRNVEGSLAILKFVIDKNDAISLIDDFIPITFFVDSCDLSSNYLMQIKNVIGMMTENIEDYFFKSILSLKDKVYLHTYAVLNHLHGFNFQISRNRYLTNDFFEDTYMFFKNVLREINYLLLVTSDSTTRQLYNNLFNDFVEDKIIPSSGANNLYQNYENIENYLKKLSEIISKMMRYENKVKVDIANVELIDSGPFNRLTIVFEKPLNLFEYQNMSIFLFAFSNVLPNTRDIRIGIGNNTTLTSLPKMKDGLKSTEQNDLDFIINYPINSSVISDSIDKITLYLPTPLGENKLEFKNDITIYVE